MTTSGPASALVGSWPRLTEALASTTLSSTVTAIVYLPGMTGLELLRKLRADGHHLPAIMITGESDVAIAVEAMRAGATDFIEKPIGREELIASLDRALEHSRDSNKALEWRDSAATHLAGLTPRQVQVMEMVLAGQNARGNVHRRTVSRFDHVKFDGAIGSSI